MVNANQPDSISFTRDEFYEKVWSLPATKLGRELGCSDVMIGKICKKYQIPKPYAGYWAQLEFNKNPKKTPLPKNHDPNRNQITFVLSKSGDVIADAEEHVEYDPDIQEALEKAMSLGPVQIPASLRNPHHLIVDLQEEYSYMKKIDKLPWDKRPTDIWRDRERTICVYSSEKQRKRSYRIMNVFLRRLELVGGSVKIEKRDWRDYGTFVYICGEMVTQIRLREKYNQIRLSPEERKNRWERTREEASGLLLFDRGPSSYMPDLLRDTPTKNRTEECLNDLVIKLIKMAGDKRIEDRKRQEEERRRAEAERIRKEIEAERQRKRDELVSRQEQEQAGVDELIHNANSWQQSKIVEDFLFELSMKLIHKDGCIYLDGESAQYLRWAHQQVQRLDPLQPSPYSVLDENIDDV